MSRHKNPSTDELREQVARALGWTVEDTRGFSLLALREFVRLKSPNLAAKISSHVAEGAHFFGPPIKRRRRNPSRSSEFRRGSYFGRRTVIGLVASHGGSGHALAHQNLWHLEGQRGKDDFDKGYIAAFKRALRAVDKRRPTRIPRQSIRLRAAHERRNPLSQQAKRLMWIKRWQRSHGPAMSWAGGMMRGALKNEEIALREALGKRNRWARRRRNPGRRALRAEVRRIAIQAARARKKGHISSALELESWLEHKIRGEPDLEDAAQEGVEHGTFSENPRRKRRRNPLSARARQLLALGRLARSSKRARPDLAAVARLEAEWLKAALRHQKNPRRARHARRRMVRYRRRR